MPSSKLIDRHRLSSSSYFSDQLCFPPNPTTTTQKIRNGFLSKETTPDHYGNKPLFLSPMEKFMQMESQAEGFMEPTKPYLNHNWNVNSDTGLCAVGKQEAASYSSASWGATGCDRKERPNLSVQSSSFFIEGEKNNMMGTHYENSLFSSAFSDLFTRKLNLSTESVDAAAHCEEDDLFESLEELEAQTIGNLLPDDDDLFSGVTDRLEYITPSSGRDDMEDLDFFSSVGGLDLGDDRSSILQRNPKDSEGAPNGQMGGSNSSIIGEHPFGKNSSRTLFVRNINSNVDDSELRALFEQFGKIRTLYMACKHRGFVMISYYDIRAAQNAMSALQNKPLRRRKLDIHFSDPKDNTSDKDVDQGTLSVFNLDSTVSNDEIHQIFGVYGEIKDIREIPNRSNHKFIEFYDVRAAESALRALNRSDIAGKRINLEHGTPGGTRCLMQQFSTALHQNDSSTYLQENTSPNDSTTGLSGLVSHGALTYSTVDNETISGVHSAVRAPSSAFLDCKSPGPIPVNISPMLSERLENGLMCRVNSNGHSIELCKGAFGSSGNGSCPLTGHHYMWNNLHSPQPPGVVWPNSSSFVNGVCATAHPSKMHGVPSAPSHMLTTVSAISNHHVGSAPTVNPSLWERQHAYARESAEASAFLPGSLGSTRISNNSLHALEFVPPSIFPGVGGNCVDLQIRSKNVRLHSHHQRCLVIPRRGQMVPTMSTFDAPNERSRSRRTESSSGQADNKKQYELDIERIMRGEDTRTTLMVKNIPNKYTSKMLLATIDERHRGTYDFIYLPIDFKNKCNVGYAFINMTDPSQIIPFYEAFNRKKWEKFNSEKVASLAYARIQGKAALIAHFQNSSLMNEDKRCRPILFHTDGPNAGDQVPFPMGVNVRSRPGKNRTCATEENYYENSLNPESREESSSNGDSSSGSAKELD